MLLLALASLGGCVSVAPPATHALSDGRYTMGTLLEVDLHGVEAAALARARDRVFATAERLDALVSRYREDSDVSRINAAAGGQPVQVAPEVAALLRASILHAARTRGAFDVTVGPLVSLWMRAAEADALPGEAQIERARAQVGTSRVRVAPDDRVTLQAGSAIDLGGIAKGFALDRMLPQLRDEGVTSALLSFGQSSVWALGAPPDGPGWRLLARAPEGGFVGIVVLRDLSLSVSGSLGQWSEIAAMGHLDFRFPLTTISLQTKVHRLTCWNHVQRLHEMSEMADSSAVRLTDEVSRSYAGLTHWRRVCHIKDHQCVR